MFSKWFASSYHLIRAVIFNIFNELRKKLLQLTINLFAAANIKSFLLFLYNILILFLFIFWMVNLMNLRELNVNVLYYLLTLFFLLFLSLQYTYKLSKLKSKA